MKPARRGINLELLSLSLSLKPISAPEQSPAVLPAWWGRAAHALLLKTVRQVDENLAAELHADPGGEGEPAPVSSNQVRPFTTSTLIGRYVKGALDPQAVYSLRLTAFREDVAAILEAASANGILAPGQSIELDYLSFAILNPQSSISNHQSSTGNPQSKNSYQELSAPYLLGKTPAPRRISLQLSSPTTFKSAGKHLPLPLPGLVFGSLLERWNAYAPVSFPAEVKRYADECLAISQYELQTRPVPQKSRGLRVGAVGKISYTTLNYDRYWMSLIATLAEFSLFSGLGAGTTQGLGQCCRIEDRETGRLKTED